MTREEAIIEMQRMKKAYCNTHTDAQLKKDSKIIDALDIGIKDVEQRLREDCISRQSEEDKELCRRIDDMKTGRNMHEHELIEESDENRITLIEKPVTIGDTVYFVLHDTAPFVKGTDNEYEIIETQITDVSVNHGFTLSCDRPEMFRDWSEFGTTVFLSRKEAEESIK